MAAAAEAGHRQVAENHIRSVATSEFGLDSAPPDMPEATPAMIPPATASEPEPMIEPVPPEPEAQASNSTAPAEDDDIPELIQDTLPDLEVLAPQLTAKARESTGPAADRTPRTIEDEYRPNLTSG